MKILDMLAAGKITAEQAARLLDALNSHDDRGQRSMPRFDLGDLRNIGAQISSAVGQSLGDMKRVLEHQMEHLSSIFQNNTITATQELTLPEEIAALTLESANGRFQVSGWDQPYVRIQVRAQVRAANLKDGQAAVQRALETFSDGDRYQLAVILSRKDHTSGAQVVGAGLDVYVPRRLRSLSLRTENGAVHLDSACIKDVNVDTSNGGITLYQISAERIRATTENGKIELRASISPDSRYVYAATKNGSVYVDGISEEVLCEGTAHVGFGRVELDPAEFDWETEHGTRRTVRFAQKGPRAERATVRMEFEAKNGTIRIRRNA